jgi:predicted Zn-dependent peptidase
VPVVAVLVMYDVGSRNERVGKTGFAHLFEHLMFQGSENVPREMHFRYVESNGGIQNGFTSQDCTCYYDVLPAAKLPLGLWLEADRMRALNVSQENLDNQRDVVKEERRMHVDNQPYALARERLREIAYDNFANQHSVIGSMIDLDHAALEDTQSFFRTYYAPNNATLVISGNFEEERACYWIQEFYSGIAAQPSPPPVDVSESNRPERREVFEDPLAKVPAVIVTWKVPERNTPDNDALQVAAEILFGGTASRMYQRMVKREAIALSTSGWTEDRRGPGLFSTFVLHKPEVAPARVEAILYEEVARIAQEGVTDLEMERVRARLLSRRVSSSSSSLQTPLGRALALAEATLFDGDPEEANRILERVEAIIPEQVQDAANRYLNTDVNRTVMHIVVRDK